MASTSLPRERGTFDRTQNHWWWRDGWAPGTRYLTWHLTFEGATELHETVTRAAAPLARVPAVDVVPVEGLHLTMTGVGFANDFSAEQTEEIARRGLEAAKGLDVTPLVFDRVHLYSEGVCLSADSEWAQELKRSQADLVRAAGSSAPTAGDEFHPHVSLAYFSSEIDEQALSLALDESELRTVTVRAPRLSLLELGRDGRVYTWRVLAQRTVGG